MTRTSRLQHPDFLAACASLSSQSDTTWLLGLGVGLGLTLGAAYGPPGLGQVLVYLGLMVRAGLYLRAGDAQRDAGGAVIAQLFAMGLIAGVLELVIDWVLVHGISHGALVYLGPNDVVLLASPVWMPLAWACVIVELGYPTIRIFGAMRRGRSAATAATLTSVIIAIAAGVTVGFYEYFAAKAGWWKYEPARVMLGDVCAAFIPLGEAFMFAAMLPVAARMLSRPKHPRAAAIESGALFALAIGAGYGFAYLFLEAGRPV
ncbi:MAG: hypothetical protein U0163_00865 [Gemmatimonadaceae bacterium]